MRRYFALMAHFLGGAFIVASTLTTLWIMSFIWTYGRVIVVEPSRLIIYVEVGMAAYGAAYAVFVLASRLYEEVRKCQV